MLLYSSRSALSPKDHAIGSFSVASWNVNFGIPSDTAMIRSMGDFGTDAVFLQETTPLWESAIRRSLSGKYPHMKFIHSAGAGGLAVLSRHPISRMTTIQPPPRGWFPAMLITLKISGREIQFLNVHLHPPFDDRGSVVRGYFSTRNIRRREIGKYHKMLTAGIPTIILGDFNEEPGGKAVSYLVGRGYSTLPSSEHTWHWKTSFYITLRSQLDHVLFSGKLRLARSRVVRTGRSDHFPVLATFHLIK